jgi:hypothetical protein
MLVADLFAEVKERCPQMTQARFLTFTNELYRELGKKARVLTDVVDITLISNASSYAIASTVIRIWGAIYMNSATSFYGIEATSIDALDDEGLFWRNWTGTPRKFAVDTSSVGARLFVPVPAPNIATSGTTGYPKIRLYVSDIATLGIGDSFPDVVDDMSYFKYGCWQKYFETRDPKEAAAWKADKNAAQNLLIGALQNFAQEALTTVVPFGTQNERRQ